MKLFFSETANVEATGLLVTLSFQDPFSVTEPLSRQNSGLHQAGVEGGSHIILCVNGGFL